MDQLKQIGQAFTILRRQDPAVVWQMLGVGLGVLVAFVLLGVFVGPTWVWIPLGVLLGLLGVAIVFGRRFQAFQIAQIEGTPGAAAAVLQNMRGAWEVTPAVAFNRREDMIHLVVGRPGVVLVAEGNSPARLKQLIAKERRRFERAAGDMPVNTVMVGDGEDQVALGDLVVHVSRLPSVMKSGEVGALHRKLDALGASAAPMPKGPQMRRAPKKYR